MFLRDPFCCTAAKSLLESEAEKGLLGGPGGGVFTGTEADLLHADIEAYRRWLREGGHGPGPGDEERDIVFWI